MRLRLLAATACTLVMAAAPLHAQTITGQMIDRFIVGRAAEKPELSKVGSELDELDKKIRKFRECYKELQDAGQVVGTRAAGFAAKALTRARCGATSDEGYMEDRQKLLENPERVGSSAAGMSTRDYARVKEVGTAYLGGSRNFADDELKILNARAKDLSNALGLAITRPDNGSRNSGGGGIGGAISGAIGNAVAGQLRMFTPDMTWAYVMYLNGILYMSGATMFETDYKAGEWTKWEIKDASRPEESMVLERAMLRRDPDRSEWWRTKTISVTPQQSDTIIMETQLKPLDKDGLAMQMVRMRGKFPGDSVGKEMMVPENMQTVRATAWGSKPTPESIAGATVGTESIKVGAKTYTAKHVRFGSGGGDMDWWMAASAPGGLVKVQSTASGNDAKWTMELTATGTGAKSELGMK